MLICPECYIETAPDATACPTCGAKLVSWNVPGPPPSTEELPSTQPLSQIKRAAAEAAAELARVRARSSGKTLPPKPAKNPESTFVGGPRLRVIRGMRLNVEYPLHEGSNLIGRRDEHPIDIDVTDQEPSDRVEVSRQHAIITLLDGALAIEDLRSRNGTFVNRVAMPAGEKRPLAANDIVQIGKIQLRVTI